MEKVVQWLGFTPPPPHLLPLFPPSPSMSCYDYFGIICTSFFLSLSATSFFLYRSSEVHHLFVHGGQLGIGNGAAETSRNPAAETLLNQTNLRDAAMISASSSSSSSLSSSSSSFVSLLNWLHDLLPSSSVRLPTLVASNAASLIFFLRTFQPGLLSISAEVADLTCQLLDKVFSVSLSLPSESQDCAWSWFMHPQPDSPSAATSSFSSSSNSVSSFSSSSFPCCSSSSASSASLSSGSGLFALLSCWTHHPHLHTRVVTLIEHFMIACTDTGTHQRVTDFFVHLFLARRRYFLLPSHSQSDPTGHAGASDSSSSSSSVAAAAVAILARGKDEAEGTADGGMGAGQSTSSPAALASSSVLTQYFQFCEMLLSLLKDQGEEQQSDARDPALSAFVSSSPSSLPPLQPASRGYNNRKITISPEV